MAGVSVTIMAGVGVTIHYGWGWCDPGMTKGSLF